MNELDQAIVAAQLAPEWLYQLALYNATHEQHRIAKCVAAGVMGYDLTRDKSRPEGTSEGAETDQTSPGEGLAGS